MNLNFLQLSSLYRILEYKFQITVKEMLLLMLAERVTLTLYKKFEISFKAART